LRNIGPPCVDAATGNDLGRCSMRKLAFASAAFVAVAAIAAAQPRPAYTTGPHNIVLPADWETRFVRYTTTDNANAKQVRYFYVNPEAYAATRAGQLAPPGTLLIRADMRARLDAQGNPMLDTAGRYIPEPGWINILAQQKEEGWGEGYGPELRNANWEYAAFDGAGQRRNVPLNACFTCHLQARPQQDFNFTYWDHAAARR
jgi:hypothetical protein